VKQNDNKKPLSNRGSYETCNFALRFIPQIKPTHKKNGNERQNEGKQIKRKSLREEAK
jgi:hypothetical protein